MSSSRLSSATLPGYTRTEAVLPSYTCLYPLPSTLFDCAPTTVHSFPISKKTQTNWATLTLMSHAKNSSSIPLLYAGNVLKGSIKLSLTEPKTIRGISVTVSRSSLLVARVLIQILSVTRIYSSKHAGTRPACLSGTNPFLPGDTNKEQQGLRTTGMSI